jgi:hypothetical protein
MRKARLRLITALAGATFCLGAVAVYGQDQSTTNAPTGTAGTATPDAGSNSAATQSNAATAAPQATTPDVTTGRTSTSVTDVTTTTGTRNFPGGFWGIVAVAVVVLVVLISLFRGRDRTVVRETYNSTATNYPGDRNMGTGTAVGDRTLTTRTASATETTRSGVNEPPQGA